MNKTDFISKLPNGNLTLLGPYVSEDTEALFGCPKDHRFFATPNEILARPYCKKCDSGKLIFGVGILDADYKISKVNRDGKTVHCKFYSVWYDMIKRCYGGMRQYSSYEGCYVHQDWLRFSNFKQWMEKQDYEGKSLDKDLLVEGNKCYSPDTCVFLPPHINTMLSSPSSTTRDLPIGVKRSRTEGKYVALCGYHGKQVHLGTFTSISDAESAYAKFKSAVFFEAANEVEDTKASEALRLRGLALLKAA